MNELTREQILNSNSKELNKWVAIHLFQAKVITQQIREMTFYMIVRSDGKTLKGENVEEIIWEVDEGYAWENRCPRYAEDISAAWKVVEKMKLIVSPNNNGGWKAGMMDGARLENHHVVWSERWVFAETAQEAICKAALLAVLGL